MRREKLALLELKEQRARWRRSPLLYIEERLGIDVATIDWNRNEEYKEHKWDGTENPLVKICEGLAVSKWMAVESATGTGKTFLAACLVFWFLECFENSLVVTTAPKEQQLTLHLWKEIAQLYKKIKRGELLRLMYRMKQGNDEWLAVGFVSGTRADEDISTKGQGFHRKDMLFILEETPGISQKNIDAFLNTSTSPHNLILALGNPDHKLDTLHKFSQLHNVEHIRISAYDHPNVVKKNSNFIAGACTIEGIARINARYGKENPISLSRTRGICPEESSDSLIRLEWLEKVNENFERQQIEGMRGDKALGVDVANSFDGDKAAICEGVGNCLVKCEDFVCPDSNQLGHRVALKIKEENIKSERVGVDGVGVGAGTINVLNEYGLCVKNIQGAEKPVKTGELENFQNLRSQIWWQLREDIRNGLVAIKRDDDIYADLLTPKWNINNGKICIEKKEEMKKRLGRSPNKGDAVAYWNWARIERNNINLHFGFSN